VVWLNSAERTVAGYVTKERVGNRNHYTVHLGGDLRHPLVEDRPIRELVEALVT
jgi:hypothetical protein